MTVEVRAESPAGDEALDDVIESLRAVVRSAVPRDIAQVRGHRDGPDGFDRRLWRRFGELGWLGLMVPDEPAGGGANEAAVAGVAEELGKAGRLEPFVSGGALVPACLAGVANVPASRRLLEAVVSGRVLGTLAWQPAGGGFGSGIEGGAAGLPLTAVTSSAAVTLHGVAHWVPSHTADVFVVAARDRDDVVLASVTADTRGVRVVPRRMADKTNWCRLVLDGVVLPADSVLGRGAAARAALADAIDTAAVAASAELIGLMDTMLELTCDHLRTRRQFGRPLGSFQALQHRAVDLWVQHQLAQAALADALRDRAAPDTTVPDATAPVRAAAVSSVKARASAAALLVGNQSVQLHGAIGFTDEYALSHYVNRALVLAAWLGNAGEHTRRYGRLVEAA